MIKNIFNKLDITISICILTLLLYSTILLYSANNQNINIVFKRIFHIIISIITMIIIKQFDIEFYKKNIKIFYFINIILLVIILINGYIIKGAQRWINIGLIQFQPSEITKIIIPIIINKITSKIHSFTIYNIIYPIIITLIPSYLIYLQPDLGTSILIIFNLIIIFFLNGINKKIILFSFIIFILFIPISWKFLLHNYQKKRILTLIKYNKKNIKNSGYHTHQSKIAIGSGGKYGKGLFKGTQSQLKFIPENKTDFIFTIIAEEHGFIGICFLIMIYIVLISKLILISIKNNNIYDSILISNFTINLAIQILINIGMIIELLPVVGIPLPLISYGGTSLISNMSIFGIIMSTKKK